MYGTYTAVDYMSPKKGGRGGVIVNVASMAGMIIHVHVMTTCYVQ